MPDDLYHRDVLAWSENQADRLRRLARGERINDVDWANVAEEIEDVGLSELHAFESFLNLIIVHALNLRAWPDSESARHWRGEVVAFQGNAARRFAPSMRQRLDLEALYAQAVRQVRTMDPQVPWPDTNPFTVDQLMKDELEPLLARLPQIAG
jgi:hypothetical protein